MSRSGWHKRRTWHSSVCLTTSLCISGIPTFKIRACTKANVSLKAPERLCWQLLTTSNFCLGTPTNGVAESTCDVSDPMGVFGILRRLTTGLTLSETA